MMQDDPALAWMALTRAPPLDLVALSRALAGVGSVAELPAARDGSLARAGIDARTRAFLRSAAARPSLAERRWLQHAHHHIVPYTDQRYPKMLSSLRDRPVALYLAGNADALNDPQLAIVGSRNPSAQGRETAFAFAEHLAGRGLSITSGLAEGIDTAAHRGALAVQGLTFAVLGCGIDVVYPPGSENLNSDIERHGALLSEFPLGTPPRRNNFPRRNRLIAALSLGTLVVEAARQSGSLITARLAGDLGREVFAIPGSIHSPLSRGCHQLIKQGAKLTETAADILSELNFSAFFSEAPHVRDTAGTHVRLASGMDKDQKILLDALGFDPADLDTLVVRTGFRAEVVSSMILILELEGHVEAAPGGRYSRVANRSRR
jgi:DNA processing protein